MNDLTNSMTDWSPDSKIAKSLICKHTKATMLMKNGIGKCNKEVLCQKLAHCHFSILIDEITAAWFTEGITSFSIILC